MSKKLNFKNLKQYFLDKNSYGGIVKQGNSYNLNGAGYLSVDRIHQYLQTYHKIDCSIEDLQQLLEEASKINPVKCREKEIQKTLALQLGGKTEVKTPSGNIDLLTEWEIIEIKNGGDWKSAIGQVISYGEFFPFHRKRVHLFGEIPANTFDAICQICQNNNIKLTYESY